LGASADTGVNQDPYCQVEFKTKISPFSYVTLMTESDKQLLEKNDPNGWTFKLTTIKDI